MPARKRKTSAGPALLAFGYAAVAPWGFLIMAGATFVVACGVGLAAGRDTGQAFGMASLAGLLSGVAVGTFRYRYRHRLDPIWQRMRRGEFRAGGR
jgi:hypothetical protein